VNDPTLSPRTNARAPRSGLSRPNTTAGRLQRACLAVLQEHEADGALPTSGRFIWYELEQRGIVDKAQARGHPGVRRGVDQDVAVALMHLREQAIVPWSWIVDETRIVHRYDFGAPTILDALAARVDQMRLDPWDGSPSPLLLCESRSLAGVLLGLATEYCCDVAATNGQAGGFLRTAVASLLGDGRRVLYLGDLDLAGGQIEANTRRVLEGYALLEWERLALTEEQADAYDLRRLAIVKRDGRYIDGRPHEAIETEALRQQVIVRIVRGRLDQLLPEPLEDLCAREREQRAAVAAALEAL
jgi:hypothetical protein